jgi:hypothetical protein
VLEKVSVITEGEGDDEEARRRGGEEERRYEKSNCLIARL